MALHSKKALVITAVILLSACGSLDLRTELERDMTGKNLTSRLAVLEDVCATHASNHHGRLEENSNGKKDKYKLSAICHDMGVKISDVNNTTQPQALKKTFSALIAQCYEEGKRVQYYKHQAGVKTRPGTPAWPFYNLDNERDLARDTEAICSLYQKEFDKATLRRGKIISTN